MARDRFDVDEPAENRRRKRAGDAGPDVATGDGGVGGRADGQPFVVEALTVGHASLASGIPSPSVSGPVASITLSSWSTSGLPPAVAKVSVNPPPWRITSASLNWLARTLWSRSKRRLPS